MNYEIMQEHGCYVAYDASGVFICSGDTYGEVERELSEQDNKDVA